MGHRRRIIIEAVSASEQRYDTVGDWLFNEQGDLVIRATGLDPITHLECLLVALHELVEAALCLNQGVPQEIVDQFDLAFEGDGEPGDAWDAPYRRQHRFAMLVEHLMARELGQDGYGTVS